MLEMIELILKDGTEILFQEVDWRGESHQVVQYMGVYFEFQKTTYDTQTRAIRSKVYTEGLDGIPDVTSYLVEGP
jgi:hypothetical protein